MATNDMMIQGVIPSKKGGFVLALDFKQVTFWGLDFGRRAYEWGTHIGPKSLILAPQDIPDISGYQWEFGR